MNKSTKRAMVELAVQLSAIPDSNPFFITTILMYASIRKSNYLLIRNFIIDNPEASWSDIVDLMDCQNDFD